MAINNDNNDNKNNLVNTINLRFAGDSGDGMQVTGAQFTNSAAIAGNDVHTFPDYPAEIRAPAGTLPGVSGFQVSFSDHEVHTSGDSIDVLVAMNPAALKVHLEDLRSDGLLLLNGDNFQNKDLKKAGYDVNPLSDHSLDKYRVFPIAMTHLTLQAVEEFDLSHSQACKCKNMFALGVVLWLYDKPMQQTETWIEKKFANENTLVAANLAALHAGYNFALTTELFSEQYHVSKAKLSPGFYRQITGNEALTLGAVTASTLAKRSLFAAGYPITPASIILQELARYEALAVQVFQAEDEIAAMGAAIGAAFGGSLALTSTSGPGLDLKVEGLGLAVMAELPLVVIDVQRAGPATGMPTKSEQTDLLAVIHGRHGECPLPVLAASTPSDCFAIMIEAFRLAIRYMTPVIVLSDGYLANAAEPWLIPNEDSLPDLSQTIYRNGEHAYDRNPYTLARPWFVPGDKDHCYRLGGLEKDIHTGHISYDPENHHNMVQLRANKINRIADEYPDSEVIGAMQGDLLLVGWGSTYGALLTAVESLQAQGHRVSLLHLRHLHPLPNDLAKILSGFKHILVAELNHGQLCSLLRARYLVDAIAFNRVTGKPFHVGELLQVMKQYLGDEVAA